MNPNESRIPDAEAVFRTMREMVLDAPPGETRELAREAGLDPDQLARAGRNAVQDALKQHIQSKKQAENIVVLHKGLSSLLLMLRRRDGLDEAELARNAKVDEQEIRRIEYDPGYLPSPRTLYRLEQTFSLPQGVLAKLSGAIKLQSPGLERRVLQFAASAKSIGTLTRAERDLLNAFVKFLADHD